MDCVLLYGQRTSELPLSAHRARSARSLAELTHLLVSEPDVLCLVLEAGVELPDGFLESLKASFSVLPVFLVPGGASAGELAELGARIGSLRRTERRRQHRFDWPLRGSLSLPGAEAQAYDLRALSASGAFLHCPGPCPAAGSRGHLRVLFRDFSLETGCEVLDTRRASSRLPDGFGVRFAGLTAEARALLERIVRDALVRTLLEPESDPPLPSLAEEDLLPGEFQPL